MFEYLMNGLHEVDAFLSGETAGHKVDPPPEVAEKTPEPSS
jgi:hypothetical protein